MLLSGPGDTLINQAGANIGLRKSSTVMPMNPIDVVASFTVHDAWLILKAPC